jgi:hypothetical protein
MRFHSAVRVRDVEEDEARHAATQEPARTTMRRCVAGRGGARPQVETKLDDGPNLILQVVSDLLNGIPLRRLRDAETIMCTVHTTLLQRGCTSIVSELSPKS